MQITRQADYALRTVLYLSRMGEEQRASTSQIAEVQQIPPSFLAKIISQLTVAGYLHTSRGAHGGVTLACAPAEISMLQVVEAIDGPLWLNQCMPDISNCPFGKTCPLRPVWCEAQVSLIKRLRETSFAQLLLNEKETRERA